MLPGKSPPTSHRSHPLPSGGGCEENLHHRPIVATRCQAVDVARKISTVWRTVATGKRCDGRTAPIVAIRCQAVDVARKISTVWRTVATGDRWTLRGKLPPSGERWLRESGGCCEENYHRLASGGYERSVDVARKTTTVWRTVATRDQWTLRGKLPPSGERWLRANGNYGRTVDA
jgi:hypothetical protein